MLLPILPLLLYTLYFLALDLIWIAFAVTPLYQQTLQSGFRGLDNLVDIGIALAVYCLLLAGNLVLNAHALTPDRTVYEATLYGTMYGIVVYGVYSGTNYIVFPQWSLMLLATDILWGAFLCGSSIALFAYLNSVFSAG